MEDSIAGINRFYEQLQLSSELEEIPHKLSPRLYELSKLSSDNDTILSENNLPKEVYVWYLVEYLGYLAMNYPEKKEMIDKLLDKIDKSDRTSLIDYLSHTSLNIIQVVELTRKIPTIFYSILSSLAGRANFGFLKNYLQQTKDIIAKELGKENIENYFVENYYYLSFNSMIAVSSALDLNIMKLYKISDQSFRKWLDKIILDQV